MKTINTVEGVISKLETGGIAFINAVEAGDEYTHIRLAMIRLVNALFGMPVTRDECSIMVASHKLCTMTDDELHTNYFVPANNDYEDSPF